MRENFKQRIIEALESYVKRLQTADSAKISGLIQLTVPPMPHLGDYATSLPLQLAKMLKKPPLVIAKDIADAVAPHLSPTIEKVEVVKPGYVNFYLSSSWLQDALKEIIPQEMQWGRTAHSPKKILVEYSSPNIAKMMHVGHFRSTLIGHALDNILRHLGHKVVNDNHLGDWGTQFGKLLVAYRLWHAHAGDAKITVPELETLYIRFHKEAKLDPGLEDQARKETVRLQQGDKKARKLWEEFCRISLTEFKRIYDLFGITFDYLHGESFYESMLPSIVKDALARHIAVESEGAIIIPLDDVGLPPYVIRKSDGGFLYATSDLATIKWRDEHLDLDLVLYVVGDQQILHFKQLFAAARKMGYGKKSELVHVPFGLILGEGGKKMSTREGEAVDAMYFIQKSTALAKKIIEEKNPDRSPTETNDLARRVALSALVYNDLSRDRESSVTFNWDTMMNFKGASAPYLLYTYVRVNGILHKVEAEHPEDLVAPMDARLLNEPDELLLLRALVKFPDTLEEIETDYRPHHLVQYLNNLANIFHAAYDRLPVAQAEQDIRRARLALFRAVALTMKTGMELLGMQPVEKM